MVHYTHEVLNESVSSETFSDLIDLKGITHLSLQIESTGSLEGSVTMQFSNDTTTFIDVPDTTTTLSGNISGIIDIVDICASYGRVKISRTSGSSTVIIKTSQKGE